MNNHQAPSGAIANSDMKLQAARQREQTDVALAEVIASLAHHFSASELDAFEVSPQRWLEYRAAMMELFRACGNEGSISAVSAAIAGIAETERRIEEIKKFISDKSTL